MPWAGARAAAQGLTRLRLLSLKNSGPLVDMDLFYLAKLSALTILNVEAPEHWAGERRPPDLIITHPFATHSGQAQRVEQVSYTTDRRKVKRTPNVTSDLLGLFSSRAARCPQCMGAPAGAPKCRHRHTPHWRPKGYLTWRCTVGPTVVGCKSILRLLSETPLALCVS